MHSPEGTNRPKWPEVLRDSNWRHALGPAWNKKTVELRIGPTMEEAYRLFDAIPWREYDSKDYDGKKEIYDAHIGDLVGTLDRLRLMVEDAITGVRLKMGTQLPVKKFVQPANNVIKEAGKMAEKLRWQLGGPYTYRSRLGSHSPVSSAAGGEASSRAQDLWKKYEACLLWPKELTPYYFKMRLEEDSWWGHERDAYGSLEQLVKSFKRIKPAKYQTLILSHDLDGLTNFYNDYIKDLYSLLVRFESVASPPKCVNGRKPPGSVVTLFADMLREANTKKKFYYSLPGSVYTSSWKDEFRLIGV